MNTAIVKRQKVGVAVSLRAKFAVETYLATGNGLDAINAFVFPTAFMIGGAYDTNAGWLSGDSGSNQRHVNPYRNTNAYNSSIVMACINWTVNAFREAAPMVYKMNADGDKIALPSHKFIDFLRQPNPFYNMHKMLSAASISYFLDGNTYLFKERANGGLGQTTALYYIPHYLIIPRAEQGTFITYYEYNVNGRSYRIPPDRIVHIRHGLDPYKPISGRKILDPVLSEIYTDEEAAFFVASLLKNTGVPGIIITPDTDKVKVNPEDAEALKENFKKKFGGANRGDPLITNFAAKIQAVGFNPEQLQFKEVRTIPEERVAAQFQISPIVVGLGAGLDKSTFNNYEQAERHSYQSCMIPLWREFGEEFSGQLLPEFTGGNSTDYCFEYDYSKVRALQESQDAVVARLSKLWTSNGIMRSELREGSGFDFDPKRDEVFYSDTKPTPITLGSVPPAKNTPPVEPDADETAKAFYLLKAGEPDDNLNQALEMSQESSAKDEVNEMEGSLDDLFRQLGEEVEIQAKDHLDRHNSESESDRIMQSSVKAIGLALLIKAIWGKMGKTIEVSAIDTVILRLGMNEGQVWSTQEANTVKSILLGMANDYQNDLISQTKAAIAEAIKGAEAGESIASIARRLKSLVSGKEMYPGIYKDAYGKAKEAGASDEQAARAGDAKARAYRAKLIAETETRTYQNTVTLGSFQKAGIQKVKVTDGDDCGWTDHKDPDKAHNSIRLLTDAQAHALAHPNCKRRFYPAVEKNS